MNRRRRRSRNHLHSCFHRLRRQCVHLQCPLARLSRSHHLRCSYWKHHRNCPSRLLYRQHHLWRRHPHNCRRAQCSLTSSPVRLPPTAALRALLFYAAPQRLSPQPRRLQKVLLLSCLLLAHAPSAQPRQSTAAPPTSPMMARYLRRRRVTWRTSWLC